MRATTNRRSLLKVGLALPFAGAGLAGCGGGGPPLAVTELGDKLSLLTGAGGNMLALATDEGLILVDGATPDEAPSLVGQLGRLPGANGRKRVARLFNTHYHLDQTGSNEALARQGATITAHMRTKLRLSTPTWVFEEQRYREARPEEAWPTETFYTTGGFVSGDQHVDFGYLIHAHTDGDIYVRFREANVLAVGDVLSPARDPQFDWFAGGYIGGRVDSLALLLAMTDADTRIVPSWGPVVGRAELEAEHALMTTLFERVHTMFRAGKSAEDMLEEGALDSLGREFADPGKLLYDIHKGLWAHQSSLAPDIV